MWARIKENILSKLNAEELTSLVDWEGGLISPRIFTEQGVFEDEVRQVFGRTWQFLAHESQFSKPGDFFATYIGLDPVLVVKQRDGSIKALLNACRHRGMKVCRADSGNLKAFTCSYHGWTYDMAGKLVNVPYLEESYYNELDTPKWGLVEIAQVASYKGLIFGNIDPDAPSLVEYLGDVAWYLDGLLDAREGGTVVAAHVHKISLQGNWKLAAEQHAGDTYHVPITHASASIAALGPNDPPPSWDGAAAIGKQFSSRLGHGVCVMVPNSLDFQMKDLRDRGYDSHADYVERVRPEIESRVGKARSSGIGTVFPNFGFLVGYNTIVVWHPKSPNTFEEWRWVIMDSNTTPEERQDQVQATTVHKSAMFDADDGENWAQIGRNMRGPLAQSLTLNYQMGVGHEVDRDETYPGRISHNLFGEMPQRGFYRRWLEFMQSKTWPHIDDEATSAAPTGAASVAP